MLRAFRLSPAAPRCARTMWWQSTRAASAAARSTGGVQAAQNVLGTPLECCCTDPMTGYYRDGLCRTGGGDMGVHVVCAQVTEEFLTYTKAAGNDLSSPTPWGFPGLKPGDKWCLCASRWAEAKRAGKAPPVLLAATHARALDHVDLADLRAHALDADEAGPGWEAGSGAKRGEVRGADGGGPAAS